VQNPEELYSLAENAPELDHPVLIEALDGFVDAGSAKRLAREHLLRTLDNQLVATFDVDQLFDYRARRPEMTFATDHWAAYTAPSLAIHALRDQDGTGFLMLAGPEPDVQWERFAAAVEQLASRLGVRLSIGLNAIPMAVPHTRPSGVIAHGSRPELVVGNDSWIGNVVVPASAGHLLEFRLGEAGFDAMGYSVNVPHYVAHVEYPAAAATLLHSVAQAGELQVSTAALDEAAAITRADIDKQVEGSEEVATVVASLEKQYDDIVAGRANRLVADGASLPSADEIAAEFEHYLSQRNGDSA
jgi:predicted ATP-grasp superfamily ATP-dependent carboligase